jgi:hypothetical protein
MGISPSTSKLLTQLAIEVTREPRPRGETCIGRWDSIPRALLPENRERPAGPQKVNLRLTLEETALYYQCLQALVSEPEIEHLLTGRKKEREVDYRLWELVCELFLNRAQYKEAGKRKARLATFVAEITKAHDTYEVLFPIEHMQMTDSEFVIGNVTFFHLDEKRAFDRGIASRDFEQSQVGKTLARVLVQAGSSQIAVERAKPQIAAALDILRVCGARVNFIHDEQLLQTRGQDYAVKNLSRSDTRLRGGWQRGFTPIPLPLQGAILPSFSEELVKLQPIVDGTLPKDLNERLIRALVWVSSSITSENYDDKVVDLCAALETLLTTKNDVRKGEALALRVLLLAMSVEGEGLLLHPLEVLELYELRSDVVHGSARNICGKRDYQTLRHVVLDAVQHIVTLATTNSDVTKASRLIATLHTETNLTRAIEWLKQTSVPETKELNDLLEYARQSILGAANAPSASSISSG